MTGQVHFCENESGKKLSRCNSIKPGMGHGSRLTLLVALNGLAYLWQGMFQELEERSYKEHQGGLVVTHIIDVNNSRGLTSPLNQRQVGRGVTGYIAHNLE